MFFIGSNVINWPLEARRAITDGEYSSPSFGEFYG